MTANTNGIGFKHTILLAQISAIFVVLKFQTTYICKQNERACSIANVLLKKVTVNHQKLKILTANHQLNQG